MNSVNLKFRKILQEEKRHLNVLKLSYKKLSNHFTFALTPQNIETIKNNFDHLTLIDQISYRYIKLQDSLGKLIRLFLSLKGENVENLPILDVLNLAEKYNLPISKEKWFDLKEIRNIITYEYEDEDEKISNFLNLIFEEIGFIENLIRYIENGAEGT